MHSSFPYDKTPLIVTSGCPEWQEENGKQEVCVEEEQSSSGLLKILMTHKPIIVTSGGDAECT